MRQKLISLNLQVPRVSVKSPSVATSGQSNSIDLMSLDGAVVGQTDVDAVTVHSKTSHSSKKNVREAMDVGKTNCAKKKAAFTNQPIELSLSLDSEPSTRKVRLLYFIFMSAFLLDSGRLNKYKYIYNDQPLRTLWFHLEDTGLLIGTFLLFQYLSQSMRCNYYLDQYTKGW